MIQKVPFKIANGTAVSQILDLGADNQYIVGISIHGTWTAAKIGFSAYVPGSATIQDNAQFDPSGGGTNVGTGAWVGGPYDSTAAFDTVKDTTGTAILYGNGTDTSAQFIVITRQVQWEGAARYLKVTSSVNQGQDVNGYLLVRKP
jgi:hypothetical protein